MAPKAPDTAGASQKPAQRSRIVPAVPLAFSKRPPRHARPITPVESHPEAVTQAVPEPQAVVEKAPDEHPVGPAQDPPTPNSRAATENEDDVEEPHLASSPAASGDDHVEQSVDTRAVSETKAHTEVANPTSSSPHPQADSVNGSHATAATTSPLPPPFEPSTQMAIQQPAQEAVDGQLSQAFQLPSHRPRPSVEGIVFGAAQESPAISSTPREVELETTQQHLARPPPGLTAPQQLPPSFYPGHSYHPSDPSSWMYSQYSVQHSDAVYGNGQDYVPSSFPTGPGQFPALSQGQLPSQSTPIPMNGNAGSHPQSPSKPSSEYEEESRGRPYQNGNIPLTDVPRDSTFVILDYLRAQFGNPEFVDLILQVRSQQVALLSLPVHRIIVSNSPVIYDAIRRSASSDSPRLADILTLDKFVTSESLNEAVKVLYGAPLIPIQSFLHTLHPFDYLGEQDANRDARTRMSQAISYTAAARVLQIPIMQEHGLEMAKALLRWDTIDQALHFGLSEGKLVASHPAKWTDAHILLQDVVDFIAYNFPVDFDLYSIAPELRDDPRLPSLVEFRPPTHNPRLSKLRFGDAPPEDDLKPNYATRILSSVLLSLPLPVLERILNHRATARQIGWSRLVKIMTDVVEEREKRRQKVLKGQIKPPQSGLVPVSLLENLHHKECVDPIEPSARHASGHRLLAIPDDV